MADLQNTQFFQVEPVPADPGEGYFGDRIQSVERERVQSGESDCRIYHVR